MRSCTSARTTSGSGLHYWICDPSCWAAARQSQARRWQRSAAGSRSGALGMWWRSSQEMVLMPLLYPHVFKHLASQPPRGILFHGLPGTGKTLAARALAGALARNSPVPVTFYSRKGADCLGKYSGEAELTLRLLFQEVLLLLLTCVTVNALNACCIQRLQKENLSGGETCAGNNLHGRAGWPGASSFGACGRQRPDLCERSLHTPGAHGWRRRPGCRHRHRRHQPVSCPSLADC